uniref:Uncharacterized protein n=1 Tax=Rhizophagus irregularis (strain DAOM 181602 / DAOM 197198 / MUCL 43194) TaxID=747089 RepID=U9U2C7_RHIID
MDEILSGYTKYDSKYDGWKYVRRGMDEILSGYTMIRFYSRNMMVRRAGMDEILSGYIIMVYQIMKIMVHIHNYQIIWFKYKLPIRLTQKAT